MEPETTGSTARFELLTKFRGMSLLDEDKEPPEFRRIIDLEWQKNKPRGWKGARNSWKQWLVVTELIPEKHQEMIDEAEDVKDTYESFLIQHELYIDILKAPRELQPREILETPDDDDDNERDEQ